VRKMIVAMTPERVIGLDGRLPWHHPADLSRFKRLTLGSAVLMGRHTWESLPKKPLPGRRNLVLARAPIEGVETFSRLADALDAVDGDLWFIGGARLYAEALPFTDLLDVTWVPDRVDPRAPGAVLFPDLDLSAFEAGPRTPLDEDPRLMNQVFMRRGPRP
jgi:dihydrofolate reductase